MMTQTIPPRKSLPVPPPPFLSCVFSAAPGTLPSSCGGGILVGEGEGREEGGAIRSMSSHESERRRRKKGGRREERGERRHQGNGGGGIRPHLCKRLGNWRPCGMIPFGECVSIARCFACTPLLLLLLLLSLLAIQDDNDRRKGGVIPSSSSSLAWHRRRRSLLSFSLSLFFLDGKGGGLSGTRREKETECFFACPVCPPSSQSDPRFLLLLHEREGKKTLSAASFSFPSFRKGSPPPPPPPPFLHL